MAIQDRIQEEALIERHIDLSVDPRGPAYARLTEYGTPVWALIGLLKADGEDERSVARAYDISDEAMAAALAFYGRHADLFDALILLNSSD